MEFDDYSGATVRMKPEGEGLLTTDGPG